jgi:hypothetical protein
VLKNGVDYDNFNDLSGMISKDRWNPWEFVRQSNEGLLESALTRYGSNGTNNMSLINSRPIMGLQADVKVVDIQSSGARPQARLYGSFYNDGTGSSTPGDIKGDVSGIVGILEQGSGPQAFYAVSKCTAPNCNLPGEYDILYSGIFKDVQLDETHRFSISWNGVDINLGCDGDVISYNPTSVAPIVGPPKGRKGIGTRVSEIEPDSTEWGYVSAAFDNVVITKMDSDLDGLDDAWEMANFGNLSQGASGDPDGDGLTNLQEYRYGTNPNTPDYKLTVTKSGTGDGTITRLPLGIDYAPSQYLYPTGTTVTLTATPAIASSFAGWSGGGCSGIGQCTITMAANTAVTATFVLLPDTTPPVTTASPVGGTYNSTQSVTLTSNEPATIYYSTDGSTPTTSSPVYSAPINISSTTSLKFFAIDSVVNTEAVKTETYTMESKLAEKIQVPSTAPKPGEPLWVTATLYNNTGAPIQTIKPDCFNTFFSVIDQGTGIPLDPACRIRAAYGIPDDVITIAANDEFTVTCDLSEMYSPGVLTSGTYNVAAIYSNYIQDPLFGLNLFKGTIESSQSTVTIAAGPTIEKKTAQIIFAPDVWAVEWAWTNGPAISAQISNVQDHTVNQIDVSTIRLNGKVPIIESSSDGVTLTATFNGSLAVQSLGSAVSGNTAYPTIEGTLINGDIFYGKGQVYLPLRTTASPVGATYNSPQSIRLECNKPATIYYTNDGSEPTTSSLTYSDAIPILNTTTLKFFAKDSAGNTEEIKSEPYTINLSFSETHDVPATPVRAGEPLPVTATFTNNTVVPIQTIRPDCFNTFFSVTDPDTGEPLNPTCRIRAAYGIPDDVITIGAGESHSVDCNLSEMYSPDVLNGGGGTSKTYNVETVYFNYIQDPRADPVTGACVPPDCYPLLKGAINSTEPKTVTIVGQSSFIIAPSAGLHGSIIPSTPQVVASGQRKDFTITPDPGYHIFSVTGCGGTLSGNTYTTGSITADCTVTATFATNYNFYGFFSPVDNVPTVNVAKAGQAIPLKWRITDTNGVGISSGSSVVSIESNTVSCGNFTGDPSSDIETYTGSSGLQYLGDGNWQYNWKTPKTYAGQCRMLNLTLNDGSTHSANFKFK